MIESDPSILAQSMLGELRVYKNDLITTHIREFGNHCRPEFAFALAALDQNMAVFDFGAHIGTFTIPAAQKVGRTGRVLAVEGNETTFRILTQNIQLMGLQNVRAENCFLAINSNYELKIPPNNSGGAFLVPQATQGISKHTSLDELVKRYFMPDFIKLDIEGNEYHVLWASEYVRATKPLIYMEVCPQHLNRMESDVSELSELMQKLNYEFFVNSGERNARHDFYKVSKIPHLSRPKVLYDVLCVEKSTNLNKSLTRIANLIE